jgi:hypothetical protein
MIAMTMLPDILAVGGDGRLLLGGMVGWLVGSASERDFVFLSERDNWSSCRGFRDLAAARKPCVGCRTGS